MQENASKFLTAFNKIEGHLRSIQHDDRRLSFYRLIDEVKPRTGNERLAPVRSKAGELRNCRDQLEALRLEVERQGREGHPGGRGACSNFEFSHREPHRKDDPLITLSSTG